MQRIDKKKKIKGIIKWIFYIIVLIVIIASLITVVGKRYINNEATNTISALEENNKYSQVPVTYINGKSIKDLPEKIVLDEAVKEGYFVYDGTGDENKVYNKNVLDRFIKNTEINATNRVVDKIRIVVYNYDGYPTIYDLEYKIFDETYMNEKQEEVHKTGYILTTDTTRNNIILGDIKINDDIPGDIYGITLTEEPGVNAVSISLSLYAIIDYVSPDVKQYQNIEIARYLLDADIINEIVSK